MKLISLLLFLLFTSILILFLFSSPIKISSPEQVSSLEENQRVVTTGKVISEEQRGLERQLTLDNNISISTQLLGSFYGKQVKIVGVISRYNSLTTITTLSIERLPSVEIKVS